MAFDDVKEFNGRRYSGMPVGGTHAWDYPDGRWRERKVAPDRWEFSFESTKRRRRAAPAGSGAKPGTQYHWYVMAHQRVRKVDKDSYETLMEGVKHKVAHKRPHWRKWSSEYPDQAGERERLIAILESALARLRGEPEAQPTGAEAPSGRPFPSPAGREGRRTRQASLESAGVEL